MNVRKVWKQAQPAALSLGRHGMRPIAFVFVTVVALAGVVAHIALASELPEGSAAPIF